MGLGQRIIDSLVIRAQDKGFLTQVIRTQDKGFLTQKLLELRTKDS
jgi:hypothetical protein